MVNRKQAEVIAWLREEPPIDDLIERFPGEWKVLRTEAAASAGAGDDALRAFARAGLEPARQSTGFAKPAEQQIAEEVRRRMLLELLRQTNLASETGTSTGRIRFNRCNGTVLQRLFFDGPGLNRKQVSMAAYRLLWPLARQRRLLLPLVRRQGIYCFYSRSFVKALAERIGDRRAAEVAAGDGTLTRFLLGQGVSVSASDDYSWGAHVAYDAELVERLDAIKALKQHAPEVVICSWPPPGNRFERRIFETASVQTYVLITSPTEADAGDWNAYRDQAEFEMAHDAHLSRLVLPAGRSRVYVFTRR